MRLYLCSLLLVILCKVDFTYASSQKKSPCFEGLRSKVSSDSRLLEKGINYTLFVQGVDGSRKIIDATYEGFIEVFPGTFRHRFHSVNEDADGKGSHFFIDFKNLDDLKDVIVSEQKNDLNNALWLQKIKLAQEGNFKIVKLNEWVEVAHEGNVESLIPRLTTDAVIADRAFAKMGFAPSGGIPVRVLLSQRLGNAGSFAISSEPIKNSMDGASRMVFFLSPQVAQKEKKNVGIYIHEFSHAMAFNQYGLNSIINKNKIISEAVADFMSAQSISSPKVFYTLNEQLYVIRDISQLKTLDEPIATQSPLDHFEEGSFQYHRASMAMSHMLWRLRELEGAAWIDANFKKILDLIDQSENKVELIHGIKETKKRYPKHYDFIEYEYALGMLRGYVEKHAGLSSDNRSLFLQEFDKVVSQFSLDPKQIEVFSSMVERESAP